MEQEKIVTVNWYKNKVFGKKAKPSFEKCYLTGLQGRGLIHANNPTCEYPQHCIVVDLGAKHSLLRKVNEPVRLENISFGNVSIIPALTNDWEKIESEVIILSIEPDLLNRIARETEASSIELKPTFAQRDVLIQSIALNIKLELDSLNSDRLYVESLFQALLMHLIKHYCIKESAPQQIVGGLPPYKLKQAINHINGHLDENIKIKDVATLIGISQYYFCRLFRESTGISPYRYVIQQRISKVKALIEENRLSLSDIAIECGFSSQSQMTHHFRKLVGITPKVYRVKK